MAAIENNKNDFVNNNNDSEEHQEQSEETVAEVDERFPMKHRPRRSSIVKQRNKRVFFDSADYFLTGERVSTLHPWDVVLLTPSQHFQPTA
eukprot:CAMPEP_0184666676 /NCGR_PEP_ID=MMETSP0308-20130426/63078_1 /TAXON_ID=38269 /ORGANISM="Gloeochaete witrockiana, Strain SAG 46.84" /LENGTH=90 /DNA_ID=CAMNT_0027111387 /DNA_START=9 /DNA_END=281 /DNA_ORIENTATION=+